MTTDQMNNVATPHVIDIYEALCRECPNGNYGAVAMLQVIGRIRELETQLAASRAGCVDREAVAEAWAKWTDENVDRFTNGDGMIAAFVAHLLENGVPMEEQRDAS